MMMKSFLLVGLCSALLFGSTLARSNKRDAAMKGGKSARRRLAWHDKCHGGNFIGNQDDLTAKAKRKWKKDCEWYFEYYGSAPSQEPVPSSEPSASPTSCKYHDMCFFIDLNRFEMFHNNLSYDLFKILFQFLVLSPR